MRSHWQPRTTAWPGSPDGLCGMPCRRICLLPPGIEKLGAKEDCEAARQQWTVRSLEGGHVYRGGGDYAS